MRQLLTINPRHRYCLTIGDSTRGYCHCEVRSTRARRLLYVSHDGGSKASWMAAIRRQNDETRTGLDCGGPSYVSSGGDDLPVYVEQSRNRE